MFDFQVFCFYCFIIRVEISYSQEHVGLDFNSGEQSLNTKAKVTNCDRVHIEVSYYWWRLYLYQWKKDNKNK